MSKLSKLNIKFNHGEVYGIGLKRSPDRLIKIKEEPVAYQKLDKEKYGEYLASREWWLKREAVMKRAKNICERCKKNRATAVHHRTYARIYRELLTDLQAICSGCHDYQHAKSDIDPAKS